MSAQASKAARELAKQIIFIGIPELKYEPELCELDQGKVDEAADVIQSALDDLLKVCQAITTAPHLKVWPTVQTLAERMEPWKAGE